jgi:hypothetical protein
MTEREVRGWRSSVVCDQIRSQGRVNRGSFPERSTAIGNLPLNFETPIMTTK